MNVSTGSSELVLLGEMSAHDAGYLTGQGIFCLLLLWGVWKCWSISRRPTTSRKCALSLMLILLAFLVAGGLGAMTKIVGPSRATTLGTGLMGLLMFACLVAGFILAILGLVDYSERPGVVSQGRAQAIWALVLAGVIGSIAVAGFVSSFLRASGLATAPRQTPAGKLLTFDELNFRFRAPARPWVSIDASKLNKESKLAFFRRFPDAYFFIIAEGIGSDREFSSEQLAEVGKAHLQAGAQSSRIIRESPLRVNGMDGLLVESEAVVLVRPVYYIQWFCATNGYAYQMIGYGPLVDRQRIAEELRKLFLCFELVDSARVASTGGRGFPTNFVSPHYHYSVKVTNSPWHSYPTLEKNMPYAEFGASRVDSCFVVLPAWLEGEKPDLDALASALLATMDIAYPNENLTDRKLLTEGDLEGVQFDFARDVGQNSFRYRFKILQGNGNGYLVAAWTQRRAADAEAVLADAMARVKIIERPVVLLSSQPAFTTRERKTHGVVLNLAGLYHFKAGDYEKALPLFRAAANANPDESLYVLNALKAWRYLDQPRAALEFLQAQSSTLSTVPEVRAQQAYFQAATSLTDQALTNYAALFANGYRNDTQFTEYINLLNLQRQYDLAIAEVKKYRKTADSTAVRLLEAEVYRLEGDFLKAISLLKIERERAPFNSQVAGALAEASIQAGQYKEALEASREMAKSSGSSAYAYYLKGRSELGLKWYREAKASFETAAKLAPANKDIRSYLEHASGLLGEGNNTALKDPIDVVALPAALTNTVPEPAPPDYAKSYGAYYSRRIVAVSYEPGKEYKTTDFMLARVLDDSGVAAFSTFQMPFDPLGEEIFVNEVRVMDAAGKTISTGTVADYYVLDDRSSAAASHKKILNIPVPGLQPGCQLAVTITRRELGPLKEFPFLEHSFSRTVPMRESILFLRGDAVGLKCRTSPSIEPQKLPEGRYWRVVDPMVARWEPLQPPGGRFLPMMWISDASTRWAVLASNYLASISDRLSLDAALGDLARRLVAGLDNNEAKITVLTRYVQTNCTYKAIEFGRRARLPNKPAEIARNKYGDCKDHAVLLQQMLEAAGVPARLALVSHRGPVQNDLPSLDQFDHMIVNVPGKGDGRFLDCTDKGADTAHVIPLGLAGREALILDSANSHFATIPPYPENASTIDVRRHLHLQGLADAVVEESLTLTGIHAAYMRDFLLKIPASSLRMVLQRQMGMMDADLSDLRVESLEAPEKPLLLRCAYTLKKQFQRSNDRLTGVLRAGFERAYLAAEPVDNRLTPFEQMIPLSFRAKVSVDVPEGFRADLPGDPAPKLDSRFAVCDGRLRLDGGTLNLEFECRQPTGKFKASDYPGYRQTMAQALSMLEREVVLTQERR